MQYETPVSKKSHCRNTGNQLFPAIVITSMVECCRFRIFCMTFQFAAAESELARIDSVTARHYIPLVSYYTVTMYIPRIRVATFYQRTFGTSIPSPRILSCPPLPFPPSTPNSSLPCSVNSDPGVHTPEIIMIKRYPFWCILVLLRPDNSASEYTNLISVLLKFETSLKIVHVSVKSLNIRERNSALHGRVQLLTA
jgi:hypothetical protein